MSILQEIENLKYRFILDLIRNEESFDKKRNVLTGNDAYKLCYKRYELMQQILLPLKKKLGNEIDVTDIAFAKSNDDEEGIIVKYLKDDKPYLLTITNLDYEDISVVASDLMIQDDSFVRTNKKIILKAMKNISENYLNEEVLVKSSTGKFIIKDNCDSFSILDNEGKGFSIDSKYLDYEKSGNINSIAKVYINYPKLKESLDNKENIQLIYNHLHIYEDDFSKQLTKKLTYR